jgi:hypothetical protein
MGVRQQHCLGWKIPIVQDTSHDVNVGLGQWIGKEITRVESQPVRQSVLADITHECWFDGGQVEASAGQVRMDVKNFDRQTTLCRPDIDDSAVVAPRKFLGEGLRG